MYSLYWIIFIGLLMNIPAVVPVFFVKKPEKKTKVSMAIRIYLLSVFLVLSMLTLSQNITQQYGLYPVWLLLVAVVMFVITLTTTVNFVRKHLSIAKSRAVILSSFLIVYIVRFNSVFSVGDGGEYTFNGFNATWTFFFLFACLMAYLGCMGSKTYAGSFASVSGSQPNSQPSTKEYATQSEIDYDIAMKGKGVLNDPNLSIVEQQRYRDALRRKEDEPSDW